MITRPSTPLPLRHSIILGSDGDHHEQQQGKSKVFTRHNPLEGVLLPKSPP